MIRFNLKELYKANTTSKPFLGDAEQLAHLPFMADYLANIEGSEIPMYTQIDRNFARMSGSFEPTYNAEEIGTDSVDEVLDEFKQDVFALLVKNMKPYTQFYELTKLEYNPIENYNRKQTNTVETVSNDKMTRNDGDHSETRNYGQQSSTTEYGEQVNTSEVGEVSNTDVVGDVTTTHNEKVSGYNDSSMVDASTTSDDTTSQTNTHKENPRTDTQTAGARTDSSTNNAYSDDVTYSQTKDATENHDGTSTVTTTDETAGNIGVTTTQQMAEQEVKFWNNFNFYQQIFDDILKNLCNRYDGGYDVMETPWWNAMKRGE